MEVRRVSVAEWREMSEAEQRTMIRSGKVDVDDLSGDFRLLVDEMLTERRPQPSST